jgi:hypothetical protein
VTYHLRRLSSRWQAASRTELVARAYALGVLAPGVWPPRAAGAEEPAAGQAEQPAAGQAEQPAAGQAEQQAAGQAVRRPGDGGELAEIRWLPLAGGAYPVPET